MRRKVYHLPSSMQRPSPEPNHPHGPWNRLELIKYTKVYDLKGRLIPSSGSPSHVRRSTGAIEKLGSYRPKLR
jgi:hypothetical protein